MFTLCLFGCCVYWVQRILPSFWKSCKYDLVTTHDRSNSLSVPTVLPSQCLALCHTTLCLVLHHRQRSTLNPNPRPSSPTIPLAPLHRMLSSSLQSTCIACPLFHIHAHAVQPSYQSSNKHDSHNIMQARSAQRVPSPTLQSSQPPLDMRVECV